MGKQQSHLSSAKADTVITRGLRGVLLTLSNVLFHKMETQKIDVFTSKDVLWQIALKYTNGLIIKDTRVRLASFEGFGQNS